MLTLPFLAFISVSIRQKYFINYDIVLASVKKFQAYRKFEISIIKKTTK